MKLITGNSHPTLAQSVADYLDTRLVNCVVRKFSNSEIDVRINECIRHEHVFILQTGAFDQHNSVNDFIIETLIMIDACRRSNSKSITLVIPCYPYARADKKDSPRVAIGAKMMANMYKQAGVNRVIAVDLHAAQIQGFFDIACDNLYAIRLLSDYFMNTLFKNMGLKEIQNKYIFVSPDNGGAKRIDAYSAAFKINNVIMHKQRDHSTHNKVDKVILIGGIDLSNKTAIVIDDMVDTAGTITKATDNLIEGGIKDIIIVFTHGILSGPAIDRINQCKNISRVIVTNTLPQDHNREICSKLEVVDITQLLGETVKRIVNGQSISEMFSTLQYFS